MRWLLAAMATIGGGFALKKWTDMIRHNAYEMAQEEAALEKVRFLQRLDHELKNPLTAMQIALANLEEADNAEKRSQIQMSMYGQLRRMSYLIGDLRKLATLGKGDIERVSVDIKDLLQEVELFWDDNQTITHRKFSTEFTLGTAPQLIGDRDLLQLAVHNLIDNALKFTEEDDTISLRAYVEDDHLIIEVHDTGRGIPENDLPHVWEDLYRSPDVRGIPGSGVGLAMVKGIIEQHDGDVSIESVFGDCTTVILRIPIA